LIPPLILYFLLGFFYQDFQYLHNTYLENVCLRFSKKIKTSPEAKALAEVDVSL